jgi:hypothetical protein
MATTPQMLQAINGMQANTQSQLPVIPNNGNPGGAYNMASADPTNEFPSPQVNPLAWMDPSPYMANVQEILAKQAQDLQTQQTQSKQLYNVQAQDGGLLAAPLDDAGIPVLPYGQGSRINEAPLNNPSPNDIVLPRSAIPAWEQGRIR